MSSLQDKVILISGGARGMGAACARRFVGDGAHVIVGDVLADDLEALAADLGPRCAVRPLDVTDAGAWAAATAAALERHGRLDGLVNNAGILTRTPIDGGDQARFERVVAVNQLGVYLGMQAAAAAMRDGAGGAIVNLSSIDGMIGMPLLAGYAGTKWAVRGMTKVAAIELGPRGIRCNSVHPGYIETPMLTAGGRMTEATKGTLASQVPLGHLGAPEDIAAACAFLLSDDSRYVSGAELVVDGGLIAGKRPTDG
jgi:3alpha(or 20beta)-hydroxysteroid dehydrogenase